MKINDAKSWITLAVGGAIALFATVQAGAHIAQFLMPAAMNYVFHEQWPSTLIEFLIPLAVSPLIETAILVYTTHLAKQVSSNDWIAALLGAAPVVALHYPIHPVLAAVVFIPFVAVAKGWIILRRKNTGKPLFWALTLMHAISNAITLILANPRLD